MILVAGGTGYLGRKICEELAQRGVDTMSLSRASSSPFGGKHITWDLAERPFESSECNPEAVINAIASISHDRSSAEFSNQLKLSVNPLLNLLNSKFGCKPRRIIHIGSNAEYGIAPCPQSTGGQERPTSPYGAMKLLATKIALYSPAPQFIERVVARPFLIYGDGLPGQSFLESALRACLSHKTFKMSSGRQTRDWIHVSSAASQICDLATADVIHTPIVNICTGVPISLHDVIHMIKRKMPSFQVEIDEALNRPGEMIDSFGAPFVPVSVEEAREKLEAYIVDRIR